MANPLAAAVERHARWQRAKVRASAYKGAAVSRLTRDWILAGVRSADQELRGDLRRLRGRSRDLARNNEHAVRFLGLLEENVVGDQGIQLQARVRDDDGNLDDPTNRAIEAEWREWSRPGNCTADGRTSLRESEALSVQTMAQDGEYLIRMLPGFQNRWRFAIQFLDADQLDAQMNHPRGRNGNEVRMGVEIDRWSRPVAYHVWSRHPDDIVQAPRRDRVRIPAEQILHGYLVRRVGQTRGVPWFAPVLIKTKMLDGYREAELVAARAAAAKMGFFTRNGEAVPGFDDADAEEDAPIDMDASPGSLQELPVGVGFSPWDPQHPTSAFPEFTKSILRSISTGLRASYSTLSGDLEGVNYSSIRHGVLSERDVWRILQAMTIEHLLVRLYRTWLRWSIAGGALRLGSFDPRRYHRVIWQPRGWTWVDPLDDIQAAEREVALGINSRTRLAAAQGRDFEEILNEQQREREMATARGLRLGGVAEAAVPSRSRAEANGRAPRALPPRAFAPTNGRR